MKGIKYNIFSRKKLSEILYSAKFRNVRVFEAGRFSFFSGFVLVASAEK